MISVEIAYATANTQVVLNLLCTAETTAQAAITLSGILQRFPEIDLSQQKIGIFGQVVALSQTLADGDRIEIYRPLAMDPKQARILRVQKS
jgi:putative ubiquitin-RnfH superfamily antitoxin RatB of RatAB toxin-antitoxin module